jgi:hypothetical protein
VAERPASAVRAAGGEGRPGLTGIGRILVALSRGEIA